jgi:hypothetical protein
MADADIDAAQASVEEQARWGDTHDSRAIGRLALWAKRAQNRVEALLARLTALEARVKTLEDRAP